MRENTNANKTLCMNLSDGRVAFTRQLAVDSLDEVYEINRQQMTAPVAPIGVSRRVLAHNADAFWGVYAADDARGTNAKLVGYAAFLMLNAQGAAQLRAGTLDRGDPPTELLAATGERPEVVYMWAVVARRYGAVAIPLTTRATGALYRDLPVYGTAATEAGRRAFAAYGFVPIVEGKDGLGDIFWREKPLPPSAQSPMPPMPVSRFRVTIARNGLDVEQAFAIRAAVFMAGQDCPFAEEFDGNDHSATHVVGYVEHEPAGTLRIRYFADFVKIERLAVLPRFRGTLIGREIVRTAIDFSRKKGYRKMYGHAQRRLLPYWAQFGFKPTEPVREFTFSDHEYVEVWGELAAHPEPLAIGVDPRLFLRPEGQWETPGLLEASAERPASNPNH